jgi:hypothetical protein
MLVSDDLKIEYLYDSFDSDTRLWFDIEGLSLELGDDKLTRVEGR